MTNESPHAISLQAAANDLRMLPGWSQVFRLEHEAREAADTAGKAYLRTLLADPRVKEEMARAIYDAEGDKFTYDQVKVMEKNSGYLTAKEAIELVDQQAQAVLDALARMAGV